MNKSLLSNPGIPLILVALMAIGLCFAIAQSASRAEAALTAPLTRTEMPELADGLDGSVTTQTFILAAGWNSIYLEVEPINPSPLVDPDGAGPLPPEPSLSTIEAVFAGLSCSDCLESVWTWHVSNRRMDYIMDPSEGLWDMPGWERYFPQGNVGPDGGSREFLTTLLTLHAHTGYLVKLRDTFPGTATLQVTGRPVVRHRRWANASYNLVGFPVLPGSGPTVATLKATSAISDVLKLDSNGRWQHLTDATSVESGQAYLVYYRETTAEDYTAPLNVKEILPDGLQFGRRPGANSQSLLIENLSSAPVTVRLALVDAANAAVRLRYSPTSTETVDLKAGPASLTLAPGGAARAVFAVMGREQPNSGQALLEISSQQLGTRWLIPVSAEAGSLAGLWVGEIVANDVSESRLGSTNVASGMLTVALPPRDGSGIRGAAELREIVAGSSARVAVTLTLTLPSAKTTTPPQPISGTAPYVGGYVFVDANQNGQRDPDEVGLAGVLINLTGGGTTQTQMTASDGAYIFQGLSAGAYTLALLNPPTGYTAVFPVTLPATQTTSAATPLSTAANALPQSVTVDDQGIIALEPVAYREQVLLPPYTLPQYDDSGERMEPLLNFGYIPAHDASVWSGTCSHRIAKKADLGRVLNGSLISSLANTSLNPWPGHNTPLLGSGITYVVYVEQIGANGAAGRGVACGEIVAGAPTKGDFRFRVLLRVAADGATELLPMYVVNPPTNTLRISSAAFTMQTPIRGTGRFAEAGSLLDFSIVVGSFDPRNPFKHKYAPDHDNLDAKFNPIDLNAVPPHLWESYMVSRHLTLELTQYPPGGGEAEAVSLDWGGSTWGGNYREVFKGLHNSTFR